MTFCLLLLSIVPRDDVVRESVDVVEVSHFYNEDARLIFDQLIFYRWDRGRYQVVAWRLIKSPECLPVRDWSNGGYVCFWRDGDVLRQVRAAGIRESWLQSDVELDERAYLSKEQRTELRTRPVRKNRPGVDSGP